MENALHSVIGASFVPVVKETSSKKSIDQTMDEVVIYDECGDTMWDTVLAQQDKAAFIKDAVGNTQVPDHSPDAE